MAYTVKIEGLSELNKAIEEKKKQLAEKLKEDVDKGADLVKASAKQKAPKDTHDLENSIDKNEVWDKNGRISIFVGIQINEVFKKPDAWYARMQEKGTSKMRAHPFLRPAFDENKNQIRQNIEADLKEVL